ncbi:MAG TPA: hypothetical protein VMU78_09625 [Methylocella sp.]|nr:hypothetical protein [Methylocella sp.]
MAALGKFVELVAFRASRQPVVRHPGMDRPPPGQGRVDLTGETAIFDAFLHTVVLEGAHHAHCDFSG